MSADPLSGLDRILRSEKISNVLKKAHASNEQDKFVRLAFDALHSSQVLIAPLEELCSRNCAGLSKDHANALELKDRGGAHFKSGQFIEAARYYSNSLREASQESEEGKQLASILHSNRALCLLRTGKGVQLQLTFFENNSCN